MTEGEVSVDWSGVAMWGAVAVIAVCITYCAVEVDDSDEMSDYQKCLSKCPSDMAGEFDDMKCPMICAESVGDVSTPLSIEEARSWTGTMNANKECNSTMREFLDIRKVCKLPKFSGAEFDEQACVWRCVYA